MNIRWDNIKNRVINKSVIVNDYDEYSWSELNCIYRPFAIALDSFLQGNFEIFLMLISFFHVYTLDESFLYTPYSINHPVFKLYSEYFENIFGVIIENEYFNSEQELHFKLIENISDNYVIVFPEDVYEVFYSPAYKQLNDSHFFLVKGYDLDRGIYYILDNLHNEAGVSICFSEFAIEFDNIYKLVKAFNQNFDSGNKKYFWTLIKKSDKQIEGILYDAFSLMKNMIEDILNGYKKIIFPETILISEYILDMNPEYFNERIYVVNQRNVYYKSLIKILSNLCSDCQLLYTIKEKIELQRRSFATIKNLILYNRQKEIKNFSKINETLDELQKKELDILENIRDLILEYNVFSCGESKRYIIKNQKNCYYEILEDKIKITHSDTIIYDLWTLTDNAWQLLYNVNANSFDFEICVESDGVNMSSFHCGIIFIANGKRIIFGNYRNEGIALYDVDCGNDDEIEVHHMIYSSDKYYLKVKKCDNVIRLFRKDSIKGTYEFFYELKCNLEKIGLFSKTWEKISNNVTFSGLKVNNKCVNFESVML